ncbi:hypothetical protein ACSBM8_11245 [Sphingomonas sp. ASY06-1R]|uniref:hypothetical protein n=1 Tax=Sphingomonas sp. ASY06-1R TaxID=3445771 RepID=UPI003FA2C07B
MIGARFPRAVALQLRIGIGAVLLLAMASCAPERPIPAKEVVARIGLDLPPGAKIEFSKYLPGGMDDAAMLMLVLPEADWKALLLRVEKQAGEAAYFTKDDNLSFSSKDMGWPPFDATDLVTAQLRWGKGGVEAINLGVTHAGAGKIRLLVFWHTL